MIADDMVADEEPVPLFAALIVENAGLVLSAVV
jgi:hypothetical protein